MKYLSLFSGIGGFEKGIQQSYEQISNMGRITSTSDTEDRRHLSLSDDSNGNGGWSDSSIPHCIGFSEIDKYAIETYQKHYPTHHNYGDIKLINADELPDFDLLVGGFPCQAFSIAGKRKGFEDTRGTLFFEIARILKAKQPRLFCLENVKGLLSHDNGNTFRTIVSTLNELGYDLQWQVLNSKNHGVPQNRERIFIIGHLRGTPRPEVFPFTESAGQDINQLNQPKHSNDRVYGTDGLSPTLNTMQGGNRQPFIADKNIDGKVYTYPYTPPLRTSASNYNMSLHGWGKIRRLTPTECERLQGFPDGWTIGSDTQRYKQCGNAVTVNVIEDIMVRLLNKQ